jgi:hypothetical protein
MEVQKFAVYLEVGENREYMDLKSGPLFKKQDDYPRERIVLAVVDPHELNEYMKFYSESIGRCFIEDFRTMKRYKIDF